MVLPKSSKKDKNLQEQMATRYLISASSRLIVLKLKNLSPMKVQSCKRRFIKGRVKPCNLYESVVVYLRLGAIV